MKRQTLVWLCLSMIVSGCAGSPYQTSRMDSEELAAIPDKQLMQALENHLSRNDEILNEALIRGWLLEDDIPLIKNKKIAIGMSERALILAFGQPYRIKEKIGSWGVLKEYIYGGYGPDSKTTHVYLENGQVSRWQEEASKDQTEIIDNEGGRDG
ncbi:MAG: hypothetical protein KJO60_03450 [Desulfofustis sp.]|nr:hypothetical protein [Desulfofustis sp.]